jgi:hypothetical protein
MVLKLFKNGSIKLLEDEKPINQNDVLVNTLRVFADDNFLSSTQSLWVSYLYAKTPNGEDVSEDGVWTKALRLYSVGDRYYEKIPSEVVKTSGEWKLQLFVRRYSTETPEKYVSQLASEPFTFTVKEGIPQIDDEGNNLTYEDVVSLVGSVEEIATSLTEKVSIYGGKMRGGLEFGLEKLETDYPLSIVNENLQKTLGITLGFNGEVFEITDASTGEKLVFALPTNKQESNKDKVLATEGYADRLYEALQKKIVFDGGYDEVTNPAATVKTVTTHIANIIANAPNSFDTLKEIADWIENHSDDAASMNSEIQELKRNQPKVVRLI